MAGQVYWRQRQVTKPGMLLPTDAELWVREAQRYVSRGGIKLEGALDALELQVAGLTCVDIGASTGGFTDCLLQRGAGRVFAVDVGKGLLASKLREDPRVTVMEKTNARHLTRDAFDARIDLVVVDASFISSELLMPAIAGLLGPGGRLLALVKPQFEAGRQHAARGKGVIRDPEVRETAIAKARTAIARGGFTVTAECDSPIAGPKGNLERFVLATRT